MTVAAMNSIYLADMYPGYVRQRRSLPTIPASHVSAVRARVELANTDRKVSAGPGRGLRPVLVDRDGMACYQGFLAVDPSRAPHAPAR